MDLQEHIHQNICKFCCNAVVIIRFFKKIAVNNASFALWLPVLNSFFKTGLQANRFPISDMTRWAYSFAVSLCVVCTFVSHE